MFKKSLALNKFLTKEVQLELTKGNSSILECLAYNEFVHEDIQLILVTCNFWVRKRLAESPSINKNVQLILTKDFSEMVRASLSFNKSLHKDIQLILVKDTIRVKSWLACNESLIEEVQKTLAENDNFYVIKNLFYNKSITGEIRLKIKKRYDSIKTLPR